MMAHIAAIAAGLVLDRLIGDPPAWPHPVRWIGKFIKLLTGKWNRPPHAFRNGFLLVGVIAGVVFTAVFLLVVGAYQIHWSIGILAEAVLIATGLAQKSLHDAAEEVYEPLVHKDFALAREKLSWIVGRDTAHLDESEITRGVVETVSENTSDGVTAPLFWAFLLGAPGLWLYKAINTCDSMVGYKNQEFQQFGYASARFDDLLNLVPSRITGFLILVMTRNEQSLPLGTRLSYWYRDAQKHPSPNSGWLEAATAIQLGVELGGVNTYQGIRSIRARMGAPCVPLEAKHIRLAVRHMHIVTAWFYILFAIGGLMYEVT